VGAILVASKRNRRKPLNENIQDIELEVKIWSLTPKAVLVETEKSGKVWIPRSCISDYSPPSEEVEYKTTSIFIPRWIAVDKGLV